MTWVDLRDAWRSEGVDGLVEEFRESVQFRLFRHGELRIIAHDLDQVAHPPSPDGVAVRVLNSDRELDAVTGIVNRRSGDRLRRAMAAGRICLAAWRAERPVGYTCLSSRISLRIEQFPIPLPEDVIYGWNLYVVPDERRSGIGSALTGARLRHSRALGYRIGWRAIDARNRGSVGTVRNTAGEGTWVVGHLRYVKVLGWTWSRLIPETPSSST
jgi:GNAT superfamily N-acetyltransferase